MQEFLWVEKYRPQSVADTVLPKHLKDTFSKIVESGEIPNLLFTGTAGVGKTTVAKALCNQLGLDFLLINGSEEGNIDTLRNKIKHFASTVSLQGGYKVVILDEADYLNPQSTQPALRGFIEEFSNNCRFIMTCNFKNRIIEPLHSRCSVVEFNIAKKDMPALCGSFMKRVAYILDAEGVTYDEPVIAELIMKHMPDWRRVLNELQRYSVSGTIDTGILVSLSEVSMGNLMASMKDKNFKQMRQWVTDNIDQEPAALFRKIFDNMGEYVKPQSIPQLVLILADYQYKNSFVADHELNMVACCTEIMAAVDFN
jgi:DNA polymerase III delta prime subunit|tara:strand:- start:14081 stop:15016 length:936 start_codon:yes stop_codon:yes gene_type:complete